MENFKKLCKEWDKDEVEMEQELFKTLKAIHDKENIAILNNGRLYYAKINYLVANGFIYRGYPKDRTTNKGDHAVSRGWVCINIEKYKKQKNKELREKKAQKRMKIASIVIPSLISILGIVLTRECSSESASEIKSVIPQVEKDMINTESQIDEIAQAADSTKQKSCNNDK